MENIILWTIQILLLPALSPLCVGIIRKKKARFQNRQGASVFQPYNDLWKLFHKDEVISADASWIFRFAPFAIFGATMAVSAGIPIFASFLSNNFTSDILVVIYILAIGTFFLALAGLDVGGAFGGFGASREMTVSSLAEGGLLFSLLVLSIVSGTTNLFQFPALLILYRSRRSCRLGWLFWDFLLQCLRKPPDFLLIIRPPILNLR